jgi:hypothetical protein
MGEEIMTKGKPWTVEEEKQLRSLLESKKHVNVIAEALEHSLGEKNTNANAYHDWSLFNQSLLSPYLFSVFSPFCF